jgi:hypothetical protein
MRLVREKQYVSNTSKHQNRLLIIYSLFRTRVSRLGSSPSHELWGSCQVAHE